MDIKFPLASWTLGQEEVDAVTRVMNSQMATMGKHCKEFEQQFADYHGRKHGIFVNSGSSANLLVMFLLTNKHFSGDRRTKVIVPALTWSTDIWAILQAGLEPVFVDSNPLTLQMSHDETMNLIENDPTIRAVIVTHIMGSGVPGTSTIKEACRQKHIHVIEDTCEALGTRIDGKRTGSFGDFATFSFYFSHHITTIEGGMILTDDDASADFLRAMRAHGWIRDCQHKNWVTKGSKFDEIDHRYLFITTGFNLRPTEINAVIGKIQLTKLEKMNSIRNKAAQTILEKTEWDKSSIRPMIIPDGVTPAWFGFPILCDQEQIKHQLADYLKTKGIDTRPIIAGNILRHPACKNLPDFNKPMPGADSVMDNGLYIGIHPNMHSSDAAYIARMLNFF